MRARWLGLVLLCGYAGCVVPGLEVGPGSSGGGGSAGRDNAAGVTSTSGRNDGGEPNGGNAVNGGESNTGGKNVGGNAGTAIVGEGGNGGATEEPSDCPKAAGQLCHELIVTDNANGNVIYIDEFTSKAAGSVVWSKKVPMLGPLSPRSIELVPSAKAKHGKAALVSLNDGYAEYDLTDGTQLIQVTSASLGIQSACRLPNGDTALAAADGIHVTSTDGTEAALVPLPGGNAVSGVKRHPTTGHYWFAKSNVVYEISETGTVVWQESMNAGTRPLWVLWRVGGGAYVTLGDGATVVELDSTKVIGSVGGKLNFSYLDYTSGFTRLANGDFVVANWLGRLQTPPADSPHVVELTPANEVVWKWGDQTLARQVTDVYVIR